MKKLIAVICAVLAVLIVDGCGGPSVHGDETFARDSQYQRLFAVSAEDACEAAQRALLNQGYRVEKFDGLAVRARKDFQPEEEVNVMIDFDVTCKSAGFEAQMFVNATETTNKLRKTAGATSVSVPGAGSISMPWSKSADSLVKVAGTTISDPAFYRRFFDLVATYLPGSQAPARSRTGQQGKP